MSNEKAAIRNWTRTQSRLGRQAARSVVGAGLLSSLVGIGQVWCVAVVLGHALVNWKMAEAAGPMPVWPFLAFPVLAILRALVMVQADTGAARAGIAARRRLRGEVLASVLTGGPALLRRVHSGVLASTIVDRVEALDGFLAAGSRPLFCGLPHLLPFLFP